MKFQNKLILTYSLFITVVLLFVGMLFYQSNMRFFKQNISSTYSLLNKGIVRQIDDLYNQMDFILLNFLSEEDVKSTIETLSIIDHESEGFTAFYTEALSIFRSKLLTYSIIKNYHSILFFNSEGDFFSSNFADHNFFKINSNSLQGLPWVDAPLIQGNNSIIIEPYRDPWSGEIVFGLGRRIALPGGARTFIAAQKTISSLEEILSVEEDENIDILLLKSNGDVFYRSPDLLDDEILYLRDLEENSADFSRNPVSSKDEQYLFHQSEKTGIRSLLIVHRKILSASSMRTGILILTGFLIISLVSLLYNIYSSRFLTRPLKEITRIMEETELNRTPKKIGIDVRHDEVLDLSNAFYQLVERLKKANNKEVQYTTAWLQARFDALQEQINPHFIFNTLTVISKRAFEIGDDDICETCDNLADMLRYSTSTAKRSALVEEEVELSSNYLKLMKKRLGKKLTYSFAVDDSLKKMRVPKIVLHQLVENAVNHGFANVNREMIIDIHIEAMDEGRWRFRVEDNGEGFDLQVKTELMEQMRKIAEEPQEDHLDEGFKIGGMGLVNTFLRLHLFFKGQVTFEILNGQSGGSSVSFIMPITEESNV